MLLRLQKNNFTYKHKPGKDLVVADTLSRAPLPTTDSELEKEISCYVHMVMSNLPATDNMMARLRMATEEVESLRQLKKTAMSGLQSCQILRADLVTYTKSIFARHRIPREVKSDNGPQYTSQEFGKFAQEWNIQHTTTSPYHPQANGLAERSVQTVKNLLNKANRDGRDPYVSILEYRNTPIDQVASPAQLLMSRRLRSVVPTTKSLLQPKVIDEDLASSKLIIKKTFRNCIMTEAPKNFLQYHNASKLAYKARENMESSCDGSTYRRNRKHILKTKEGNSQSFGKEDCDDPISQNNEENAVGTEPENDGDNAVSTEETSEEQLPVTLEKKYSASPLKTS
ncbi:sec1 family domain-containing 2 [Paramuricea clavata]|uniref:Sec1 family domain-containing 2 n=1 Tax=Paramuricea clavata TaxID=317549 RepID=A0A7D9J8K5_PARCT|nr:sec1 family domain-containing 2 [Paramuricea clavata]